MKVGLVGLQTTFGAAKVEVSPAAEVTDTDGGMIGVPAAEGEVIDVPAAVVAVSIVVQCSGYVAAAAVAAIAAVDTS